VGAPAVLTRAVLRAAELLELGKGELGRILGVSDSSISRLMAGARQIAPATKEGELALLLVRLYRSLDAVVGGDAAQRRRWLQSHNRALNGRPIDVIGSTSGLVFAVAYLDGARATH
jgi:uncharacterized protein (DUF2384 family)